MLVTIKRKKIIGQLAELYNRQNGRCNELGCPVRGINNLTQDHKIPRSVAILYGWTQKMYEATENKQLLCPNHHMNKDRRNNDRIEKIKHREEILARITVLHYELTR